MSSSPGGVSEEEEDERAEGKGSGRDDDDDPADGFEDGADSQQVDDAQQTLDAIDPTTGSDDAEVVDIDEVDTLNKANLRSDEVIEQLSEQHDYSERHEEQVRKLGENNLTPEVSDHINLDEATQFTQMNNADETGGSSDDSMWKAETDDGDTMFVTFQTEDAYGNPVPSNEMVSALHDSLPEDVQEQTGTPDINIDHEREAVVLEVVGDDDRSSVFGYRPSDSDPDFSKDNLLSAAGMRMLAGDLDISGNIMASGDGKFRGIDFDAAGEDLQEAQQRLEENNIALSDNVIEQGEQRLQTALRGFDWDIEDGELRSKMEEMAEQVDMDTLDENLSQTTSVPESAEERESPMGENKRTSEGNQETIKRNIRAILDGEV